MKLLKTPFVWLCVVFLAGCSRCGGGAGGGKAVELARLLPKNAEAVILVPDVAKLGERLTSLEKLKIANFAAQMQGLPSAKELTNAVTQQIGVDIRSKEALEDAGFDPSRGMAFVLLPQDQGYSVIATRDAEKLRAMVEKLSRDRLGVTSVDTQKQEGAELTRFASARGPVAAMWVKDGWAVIAAQPLADRIGALAQVQPGASLADEPNFAKGLARLPSDRHLVAYLPQASGMAQRAMLHSAALSVRLGDDALSFIADVPWPDTRASLASLEKREGTPPYAALPKDAFAVAQYSGDFSALDGIWPWLVGSRRTQVLEAAGFDVKNEVLGNLQPGGVLSLSLSPIVNLAAGLPMDPRRANPFRTLHLVAAALVKDAAKAQATLEKVPRVAPQLGATVTAEDRGGQKVYATEYSQGEGLHFALTGNTLVSGAPMPRLLDAVAAVKQGGGEPPIEDPALRNVLGGEVFTFVVDLRKLAEQVKALPSSAWGVGGFAIKATTVRWLEATSDLHAITGSVHPKEGALQTELHLRIGAGQ